MSTKNQISREHNLIKSLADDTHKLLRKTKLSPEQISNLESVSSSERWIYKYRNKEIKDAGVYRLNELRNALVKADA